MSSAGYITQGGVTSWFSDYKGTVRLLKNLRVTFSEILRGFLPHYV
jgi:hypothetical protein